MTTARFTRAHWSMMIAAGVILGIALGHRHSQGLYLLPYTQSTGMSREVFSFAVALQNIVWGVASPFTGALADRFGTPRVLLAGLALHVAGMLLMPLTGNRIELALAAGLLIGLGQAGTTWVVNGAISRGVPAERRSVALGIVASFGALGQFVMMPYTLFLINGLGWVGALTVAAITLALTAPLARLLAEHIPSDPVAVPAAALVPMRDVWRAALASRHMWMLWLGFSACGFQLAFISTHLPAYLIGHGLTARDGTIALALVGLFNIAGTYVFGQLGQRYRRKYMIAMLYGLRSLIIAVFISLPLTPAGVYLFGIAMGLLWLGINPLMTGAVAQMFGLRALAGLFGFVFLGHQVGAFLGVWLGGMLFDATGSYTIVWWLAIGIGMFATLVTLPVDEAPARIATRAAA